jgi:predicted ATPase/signal transduction histidine kinase
VNRALDYRTDLYSLGATLYELFTGVPPFPTEDALELVHCHIARRPTEPHERNPAIPQILSDILMRLLEKIPEARYQSSYGLKADLEQCLSQLRATGSIESFPLARHDVTERLLVSQALYGRDQELAALQSAFERAATEGNRATLALVTGYSGSGKSSLVHELYKPLTQRRGYFITGKFEQLQRATPYSALVSAFRSLVQQLLSESEAELAQWRRKLLDAVGSNGGVLVAVIPEVELILGPQPPIAQLGPTEAQNRFNLVFGGFVRVFAQPTHPLVIFLDDLQWADSASLKLIELLLTDELLQCLLVIGAYRDHEVTPVHPLQGMLDGLEKAGVTSHRIPLAPLRFSDIAQLVADSVGRPLVEVEQLAQLIVQKTDGNPLFVTELLKLLYEDGLLYFDRTRGGWQWEVARIATRGLSDSVVDLMLGKLRRLPESTQRAVQRAACIGSSFELDTLAIILELPTPDVFQRLLPAIQEGFLATTSGLVAADTGEADSPFIIRDHKFLHDRVQQAAYSLIGEEERQGVHLRIGRLLLARTDAQPQGDLLFNIVDQLNRGRDLITAPAEREQLARLNLEAAQRARQALAYVGAKTYLESGLACLAESSWKDTFDLTFALRTELAEVAYLTGEYERSEALSTRLLKRARTVDEKVGLYHTLISQHTVRGRYAAALAAAKEVLALLGMELPLGLSPEALQAALGAELAQVRAQLGNRSIASLVDEPEMNDPKARMITSLLLKILPAAFFSNPVFYTIVVFKAVGLSLRFGPSSQSADLFSNYGHIVSGSLGEHEAGREFGKLAVALTERFHRPDGQCRSGFHLANFIAPWTRPLRESEAINDTAFRAGLEGGDIIYTGYILIYKPYNKFYEGRPLDEVAAELPGVLHYTRRTRNRIAMDIIQALELVVENLRSQTASPDEFRAKELDEATFLSECDENKSAMASCFYWVLKAEALYLHGDFRGALEAFAKADALLPIIMGNIANAHHFLYQALSLSALWPEVGPAEQAQYREKLEALVTRFGKWADSCPENFAHLHALLRAELARLDGRGAQALDLYEQAIEGARGGGFTQHVALAAELAARYWLSRGRERAAAAYLQEARHGYRLRGAARKVVALERQYPHLLGPHPQEQATLLSEVSVTRESSTQGSHVSSRLDLGSVLKVFQALSSELVLDRLLPCLMHIVMENAGARKGALLFEKNGELVVQVDAGIDEKRTEGDLVGGPRSTPLSEYSEAPGDLIRYVARTRESVVLGNAAREGGFTRSPYVLQRATKSLLCIPISIHNRLLAVVYLENNLTEGAFTPERLELLRMLSSQLAISIENALLYREIEQRVAERTVELRTRNAELQKAIEDLRTTQRQLVHSEKSASLGRLTMGIAHELKNPLNFVNNFAKLDMELVTELEELRAKDPAATLAGVGDILEDLKRNSARICEHGERADNIIRSMLRHTGSNTRERRPIELNVLVDDFARLAGHGIRAQQGAPDVRIEHDYDAAVGQITGMAQDLGRVFVNLVGNAIDAVCERARTNHDGFTPLIRVSTRRHGNQVAVRIQDNGAGISSDIRDRIFEPFFTTKPPGMGTGLGLSLSYDIVVNGHGGTLTFESNEDEGTTFQITLPA